jgi:hypothetical protein
MSENDGRAFENSVAEWMRGPLRFDDVETRACARGATALRPHDVDVRGRRRFPVIFWLGPLGMLLQLLGLVTLVAWAKLPEPWLVVVPLGIAMSVVGIRYGTRRTWAECKDLKGVVLREHVMKLKAAVDDVRGVAIGWKPNQVLIVSRNGFDPDALELAWKYGFDCYQAATPGFTRLRRRHD